MPYTFGAGGGGGGAITNFPITFNESTTWACPVVMEAYVFVIGGGGGGAALEGGSTGRVQGGCAGGCAVSKLTLAVQNYNVTVGPGGDYDSGVSPSLAGEEGDDSSFTGSGITDMNGLGGDGGAVHASSDLSAITGGGANGGTLMNNTGGGQPAITLDNRCTSGACVGLWENGRDGILGPEGVDGSGHMSESLLQGNTSGDYGSQGGGWNSNVNWFIPPLNVQSATYERSPVGSPQQERGYIPAGATGHGKVQGYGPYASGGHDYYEYTMPGSPFSGGASCNSKYNYVYGGGTGLGGGGGGNYTRHASAATGISGGGDGGVIIIPISLGS